MKPTQLTNNARYYTSLKKLVYLFFLILLVNNSYGQTCDYNAFPEIESYWVGEHISSSGGGTYTHHGMKWHGDTTIGSVQYMKAYSHSFSGWTPLLNFQYMGGIRQDIPNEKIYYIDLNDVEHDVSIDQNAQVGDTVLISSEMYDIFMFGYNAGAPIDTFVVAQIDSVTLGGTCRKHFMYNSVSSDFASLSYWSGIGLTHPTVLNWGYSIQCHHIGPALVLGSELNSICAFVSVPEHKKPTLKPYPNPANNSLIIEGIDTPGHLDVYNQIGQIAMRLDLDKTASTIDVSGLENGMYMLVFESQSQVQYGRLVVEH